jgi:hypothetical protein
MCDCVMLTQCKQTCGAVPFACWAVLLFGALVLLCACILLVSCLLYCRKTRQENYLYKPLQSPPELEEE